MIYFTSDLHLGHKAVIKMQNRPFLDVDEMNKKLIFNYNSIVKPDDTVYILGDLSYRIPVDYANDLIKQLNGKKILIKGNHDKHYDPELFEGIYDYLELSINKVPVILMHYPLLEWNKSHRGSIHLHGHIHSMGTTYNQECKSTNIRRYDIGVDANNYYPVSFNEILTFMELSNNNCYISRNNK